MAERSKAIPITITVRPEVARFAEVMEAKLAANDHKKSWKRVNPFWLSDRLHEEVEELEDALVNGTPEEIRKEAADVAAYAMFIADNEGELMGSRKGETDG